jgi:hypothetical protein
LITPFLHTRPVIAMLSRSVGQIPKESQADIRICARGSFWRSYRDALAVRLMRAETMAANPTLLVAGEAERAVRPSNAALAALMPNATARYVPSLGHGWLGTRLDLHVAMVESWLAGGELPAGLKPESTAWSRAKVDRLLGAA